MHRFFFILFCFCVAFNNAAFSQDTLPHISVKNINHRILISWKNTYGASIANINIQRSKDSLKNFTSIGSVLEPMNKENGFVDNKAPNDSMFYRVFVAFSGGNYVFSKSYRPVKDSIKNEIPIKKEIPIKEETVITITPTSPKSFVASKFVYTGRDNNVILNLSNAPTSNYSVKFFTEEDEPIFEIKKITEPFLIVDKVNFKRSGWFHFQLFENGNLIEKNKFNIAKDNKK